MLGKTRFTAVTHLTIALGICVRWSAANSVEEDDGDQYFGVPLGALHFSSDGTSAEIYAADEFTIIFNHLYHSPRRAGCTAMMIGPARKEDRDNVIEGHGLLLAPAHPPVTARHRHRARRDAGGVQAPVLRARRQLAEQFSGWPVEFDHLLMTPSFGIQQNKDLDAADGDLKAHLQKVTLIEPSNREENDSATKKHLMAVIVTPPPAPPTMEHSVTMNFNDTTLSLVPITTTTTITSIFNEFNSSITAESTTGPGGATAASTIVNLNATTTAAAKPSVIPTQKMAASTPTMIETIRSDSTTRSLDEIFSGTMEEPATQETLPIIFFETKGTGKTKQTKLNSTTDLGVRVTSSGETISFVRSDDVAGINEDFVRRAPARIELTDHSKNSVLNLHQQSNVHTTTPLYYVIKDPREARRQRLLALKRRIGIPIATTTTKAAPVSEEFSHDFDARFELPSIRDKLATFSLVNGAKINQYKWIGLYDQCLKVKKFGNRHIPLVSLRDVDPPREEKISPLSGWSHNITSYRVHILNCNTVLIPGFTFNPANATANTYFFVGIGDFPNNVERQMRATIVGARQDEPLHAYSGEDLLLRLPNGYRTFDIDFITIYNTDEQKSYAHVMVPSLLVPPCAED